MIKTPVILSEVNASRSEAFTQSKDLSQAGARPRPRREFSLRSVTVLVRVLAFVLLLATLASAQTLTGTVKNSTTGKPSAGDEVVLLKLGRGMEEAGRTKTDAKGQFSFKLDDAQSPHLVRAIHEEVTYHRIAPPGTTSVEVEVYDAAKKIEGIAVVADIIRVQAEQGQLEIVREFGVQNSSKPPRTQMNERNLEFYIPEGSQLIADAATATTENGNPLKSAPVPVGEKTNRYSFIFPLRPGLTRFEVAYTMPYTGSANLDPKSVYPLEHFVVMLPKSMQFTPAADSAGFKLINYPNEPAAAVQVASNTKPGQNLAFKISGEGLLQTPQESGQGQTGGEPGSTAQGSRPGGGLGPPIDAPDPLQKYQWWILGGLAGALLVGGVVIAYRQQSGARALARQKDAASTSAAMPMEDDYEAADVLPTRTVSSARPTSVLLDALKEELFQLEVERRQDQITQAEYEKAKSALDQTLERALKREAQKA